MKPEKLVGRFIYFDFNMNFMRIAIFTDTFLPNIDGVVTTITNLAKNLADRGHKIYIIAPRYDDKECFFYRNVKVLRVKSIPIPSYPDYKITSFLNYTILKKLKKEKIDLIHSHSPFTFGMLGLIIAKLLKVPVIGNFHTNNADPDYLKHIKMNNRLMQNSVLGLQRFYYNKCDLIICPSNSIKKDLVKNGFKKNILVISNGVDLQQFNKHKNRKKRINKENKVLFIGRIAHEKNILYLIDCFYLVSRKLPRVKFMIIGDGPQKDEVEKKIALLKMKDKILLLGKMEHDKLIKSPVFDECKIFATASITETQGISLLEAQANGIVGVGVDANGTKDLIKNNYNGFLVRLNNKKQFAEKIVTLFLDKKIYENMRKNTLKEVKKHELGNIIEVYEKTYYSLLEKKNGRYNNGKNH